MVAEAGLRLSSMATAMYNAHAVEIFVDEHRKLNIVGLFVKWLTNGLYFRYDSIDPLPGSS
jgi:hypothetical protein